MNANKQENPTGQQALRQQVGERFSADWESNDHRARRLVSEFIGTSGLTFVLSGGAAILAGYGGGSLASYQFAFILSTVAALWLVAAVFFLGDISSHFNPAMTLGFCLRGDISVPMAVAYKWLPLLLGPAWLLTFSAQVETWQQLRRSLVCCCRLLFLKQS